jgi:hypothetical protein
MQANTGTLFLYRCDEMSSPPSSNATILYSINLCAGQGGREEGLEVVPRPQGRGL